MVDNCAIRVQRATEAGTELREGGLPMARQREDGSMDFRGAAVQDAVGPSIQLPDGDSDRGRMKVLDGIRTPVRRHNPATQEWLNRRKMPRCERVSK